jgi:hypothetical protein
MNPEIPRLTDCGQEDEPEEDDRELRGCDKLHHFLRSLYHQPNHIKHKIEGSGVVSTKPKEISPNID